MQVGRKRIVSFILWNLLVCVSVAYSSTGIAVAQVSTPAPADQLQIEKGRQVAAQVCAACHTTIVRMIQVHKQSAEQWRDTIYFMISRGAQIMPDEIEPVTAYLAATAGSGRQTSTATAGGGRGGAGTAGQPEVEGRTILQRTCQQCHELATASTKLASEDWSAVITRMMNYGARLTPADQQKLIGYLNGLAK